MNGKKTKFCSNCGAKIDVNAKICPKCGVRVAITLSTAQKSPGLAVVLSFLLPGLGQIYDAQIGRGIVIILVQFVLIIFSVFIITLLITVPALFAVWLWSIYDAYSIAEKINRGEKV